MHVVFDEGELPELKPFIRACRKAWVTQLLIRHNGNKTEAAASISMDRSNFRRLMRDLGLEWVDD